MNHRKLQIVGILLLMAMLSPSPAAADIFRYTDEDGVMHFTNAPTSAKFKLILRERKIFISKLDSNQFDPIISQASKKYGIEAPLIAVIKAESDFDPNAISHKGARGSSPLPPGVNGDVMVTLYGHRSFADGSRANPETAVFFFPNAERQALVSQEKCENCHELLAFHGSAPGPATP